MEIDINMTNENPNYLGYDEDYDGEFDDYFICPKCRENVYIKLYDKECELCGEKIVWVDRISTKSPIK